MSGIVKIPKTVHSYTEFVFLFPLHTQYDRGMVHHLSSKAGRKKCIWRYCFLLDYIKYYYGEIFWVYNHNSSGCEFSPPIW